MIYTLTLNPSIDYYLKYDGIIDNEEVMRVNDYHYKAGGKGLNVSRILNILNVKSTAITVLGGFTGQYIYSEFLKYPNISLKMIDNDLLTRMNIKLHLNGKELAFNTSGPISNECIEKGILNMIQNCTVDDIIVVSGSTLKDTSESFLKSLCSLIELQKAKLIIDMESLTIEQMSEYKPYLIKPNLYEFRLLVNNPELSLSELPTEMIKLRKYGIQNILVSLGKEGALLLFDDQFYRLTHNQIKAVNKVGCGDAMLAGFISQLDKKIDVVESLKFAGATGCAVASTMTDVTDQEINHLLSIMNVKLL